MTTQRMQQIAQPTPRSILIYQALLLRGAADFLMKISVVGKLEIDLNTFHSSSPARCVQDIVGRQSAAVRGSLAQPSDIFSTTKNSSNATAKFICVQQHIAKSKHDTNELAAVGWDENYHKIGHLLDIFSLYTS